LSALHFRTLIEKGVIPLKGNKQYIKIVARL
jgi:hypothetical protein